MPLACPEGTGACRQCLDTQSASEWGAGVLATGVCLDLGAPGRRAGPEATAQEQTLNHQGAGVEDKYPASSSGYGTAQVCPLPSL